jgi:putative aminopeptidase FrvX
MKLDLLEKLCEIPSTAGDEGAMRDFLVHHFSRNGTKFKTSPQVYTGPGFQDLVIAVFGEPRTAIFAHTDTVGFTVGYQNELLKIGNPKAKSGSVLVGKDSQGAIECFLKVNSTKGKAKKAKTPEFTYEATRTIYPGTNLTYQPKFKQTKNYVQSPYLDNRLGVWNALLQAETLEHGAIVFTTYEEHAGGSAQFAGKFLQDNFGVQQALISDVTLVSQHIKHKKGVAISLRDRGIPRRSYVNRIREIASQHGIPHQLEVESLGGSDGNQLQASDYAWDWCFIGPPESNYHEPGEKVHLQDIEAMVALYKVLMQEL